MPPKSGRLAWNPRAWALLAGARQRCQQGREHIRVVREFLPRALARISLCGELRRWAPPWVVTSHQFACALILSISEFNTKLIIENSRYAMAACVARTCLVRKCETSLPGTADDSRGTRRLTRRPPCAGNGGVLFCSAGLQAGIVSLWFGGHKTAGLKVGATG